MSYVTFFNIVFFLGREKRVHYKVSVSFLEVYNENIRDLLNDSEEFLDLREDPIKGIQFIVIIVTTVLAVALYICFIITDDSVCVQVY